MIEQQTAISTEGRAFIKHRDGNNYRAERVELRNGMVLAEAVRHRPGKGARQDELTRYAWPAGHVTLRWEEDER